MATGPANSPRRWQNEFQIDGKSVRTGVTTGISVFPHNGADAASLLANAGAALFRAKQKSRGTINVFEPEMDQQIRDRRVLHQDLSVAIKNGELSLHYQPQAASGHTVATSKVIGFEALARWMHPVRGFVSPGDFIPLAEESGLIVEMGEWILREACREAASWPVPMQIAVNLSPAQFMHGDVVNLVHSILLETGLAPDRLELEITEGVLIEDFDRGLALLRRLKALGVRISMDDFGSGYSSLSYLQAFPFDKIKIDRAFVINLGKNPQSAAIVRAVIDLGHGLDMSIVAEGVETSEQLTFLAQEGCDAVQGYLLGKPAPIGQYAALVGRNVIKPWSPRARPARAPGRLLTVFFEHDPFGKPVSTFPDHALSVAYGGLRSCNPRRRAERRQHRARCRRTRPSGDPAGAGRPRLRCILGLAKADPWRSVGAGAAGFLSRPRRAVRARRLAENRAASGAADALCDSRPCRRAPALGAAGLAVALRPDRRAAASAGFRDRRRHPPSGRRCAEAAVRHRVRIFRLRGRRFPPGRPQRGGCRRARRRHPHRRALRPRRPHRHLAAGRDRPRPSQGVHRKGAGERHRRLDRVRRRHRAARAGAAARHHPDRPDRGPPPVRQRQCLCVPEPRPPPDLCQPL